jgi:two-component system CheB/CheR fusion protein
MVENIDAGSRVRASSISAVSVEEHRELLDKLAQQSRLFEATLSAISDFAYSFDRDGRFTYVNKSLLDLWGLKLEEAVGKDFFELGYPDALAAKLQRQIQQVLETQRGLSDETPYTSPTGKSGYYEYIFAPVFNTDGAVEAVAGSTRDITARKQGECEREILLKQVQVERERLAEAFAQSPAFVAVMRGPNHVFEFANERYYRLIGRRNIIGLGVREAVPEVEGQGFFEILDRVHASGEPYIGTGVRLMLERYPDRPLEETIVDFVYQPALGADGAVVGIIAHGVDVTERTKAEAALVETNEALEAANKAKDKFLAVLSHELRTPLSPVVMTLAAMEVHPGLPEELREDVSMIRRNIDLETKLIDDLLDLSRVVTGKLRLQMRPTRLTEVLRHAIEVCASDINAKQLSVETDLSAGNDRVIGDAARLEQVFWNLLKNAIKFSNDGGKLTVRMFNPEPGAVAIEVTDYGMGIPPQILPLVFDAFEQGDARNTGQFGGLGLGLAISKAVVDMHRGTIQARSDGAGTGATFIVRIETAADSVAGEDAPRSVAGPLAAGAQARILLVEDHRDTARTMARLLNSYGYITTIANSVASALQAAAERPFDLVVSDIGLPDANGYELMQKLKDLYGMQGIALTGYGMEEDMRRGREAGFTDHVVKPVNISHLESVIRSVLKDR